MSSFKKIIINNQQVSIINCNKELQDFCKLINHKQIIAIDTEFTRLNLYYPKLCLLQISDGINIGVVDVQTITNFSDLEDIIFDTNKIKIIHSARQDIEAIYHFFNKKITNIYDTQIAAEFCQFGFKPSYAKLIDDILDHKIDKNCSYSDWNLRPLTEQQIQYAANDVAYLHDIFTHLELQLHNLQRYEWFKEEINLIYNNYDFLLQKDNIYWSKLLPKLKANNHQIIYALCCWRERTARLNNINRNQVVSDNSLALISANNNIENILSKIDLSYKNYEQLFDIIDNNFIDILPPNNDNNYIIYDHKKFKKLQSHILNIANILQIPTQLIATITTLKKLSSNEQIEDLNLTNWRVEIIQTSDV
jgi:ribonuclease D